ncbi:hypothetical protein [Pseudomonas ogarae]|uniref:hypothetical protein n=1 Tax=Pseudomonas ogarae (strain DSM 112162 / CECT 30235 / F113) TaxID=1114970 RepID=UPI001F38C9E6|nr:hypothetical protein [Pseudomonas ogarae]
MATTGPGLPPRKMPITPVWAMPVCTSSPQFPQALGDALAGVELAIAQFRLNILTRLFGGSLRPKKFSDAPTFAPTRTQSTSDRNSTQRNSSLAIMKFASVVGSDHSGSRVLSLHEIGEVPTKRVDFKNDSALQRRQFRKVHYVRLCGEAGSATGGVSMQFLKVAASGRRVRLSQLE